MTVVNDGDNSDVYTITASDTLGWANLSTVPATLKIAAHNRASFLVTVNVPPNAAPTTHDVIDIAATSQHGPLDDNYTRTVVHCPLSFSDAKLGQDTDSVDYAAYYVACRNIIAGFGSGPNARFAPQEYITRAQLAQALVVGFNVASYMPAQPTFSDVPASGPAYTYIEAAVHASAMSGAATGGFKPSGSVKRGEAVYILAHTFGYPPYNAPYPDFRDVPRNRPEYAEIEAELSQHDIEAAPCRDNPAAVCFRPDDYITRGELSRIITYMLDR